MIRNWKLEIRNYLVIILIFIFALSLRLYGINWDQGNHLHPDERFLTMVTADIKLPSTISQYFDNQTSPLNPYNYHAYQFFVYGTFPIFLTKYLSVLFNLDTYQNIVLVGRSLSAIFDSINIFLLYFLAKKIFTKKSKLIFLPSLLYATCVLPIQLSHFYAVDTFLNTFLLATFTFLAYSSFLPASIFFGLALACKISALYFLPIIFLFLVLDYLKTKKIIRLTLFTFIFLLLSFLTFRLFQPYIFDGLFKINPHFIDNIKQLQIISAPSVHFPPSVQWIDRQKIVFPLQNIIFWGLGLPLTIVFIFIKKLKINIVNSLSLVWIIWLVLYQGTQDTFSMRYFLVIYPFIILIASQIIPPKFFKLILIPHLIYCFMFLTIYSIPHSRIQASHWISQNILPSSVLSTELWDDTLPLNNTKYTIETLSITGPDTAEKWDKINSQLKSIDYIILSSNRSWASVSTVPSLLPDTNNFYKKLFSQKPLIEINSYPGFRLPIKNCYHFGPTNMPNNNSWFTVDKNCYFPGIYLRDDLSEEAFSVYDHPKVLIFKN